MTHRSLKRRSNSNANDVAHAPIGFGNVLFSEPEVAAPAVAFAPLQAAPTQEAFLA